MSRVVTATLPSSNVTTTLRGFPLDGEHGTERGHHPRPGANLQRPRNVLRDFEIGAAGDQLHVAHVGRISHAHFGQRVERHPRSVRQHDHTLLAMRRLIQLLGGRTQRVPGDTDRSAPGSTVQTTAAMHANPNAVRRDERGPAHRAAWRAISARSHARRRHSKPPTPHRRRAHGVALVAPLLEALQDPRCSDRCGAERPRRLPVRAGRRRLRIARCELIDSPAERFISSDSALMTYFSTELTDTPIRLGDLARASCPSSRCRMKASRLRSSSSSSTLNTSVNDCRLSNTRSGDSSSTSAWW